jgi:5-methyltetrahydropteroyltriglutamate--homocysteine methyltransferase
MFATLVGAYPRTPLPGEPFRLRAAYARLERGEIDRDGFRDVQDQLVREIMAEQLDAGLGMLTDGQVRWDDPQTVIARGLTGFEITGLLRYFDTNTYYRQPRAVALPTWTHPILVVGWRFADSVARDAAKARRNDPIPVKACLVGPYTLARLSDPGELDREAVTMAAAEALNQEIRALLEAGAPIVQVDENALTMIGADDDAERSLAAEALRRLTDGTDGARLMLAVTMGGAEAAGAAFYFDLPFGSYLFDLVAGPDQWRLVAYAPGDRTVVLGVADARNTRPDDEAVMAAAGRYAASLSDRGPERVGLAPSTGLEYLPRDRARSKIEALARAVHRASAGTDHGTPREPEAVGTGSVA